MNALSSTLENYGADIEGGLRLFDEAKPELLPYATLVADRYQENSDLKALWGVYEWQSTPLVFLVSGDEIHGDEHFRRIRRRVALRGDAPYLGVVRPGQLTIHRVSLDKDGHEASLLKGLPSEDNRVIFPFLANSRPNIASHSKWISSIVLKLLRDAIRALRKQNVTDDDAISLTGRALFLRFLGDRNLLPQKLGPPEQLFNDANRAESASRWLDVTFNGDFLPLSDGLFSRLPYAALNPLGNILLRAEGGQLYLGWQEKWNYLDFAHIPVGVLSETYEHYMREHDRQKQRKEGSFYTPRAIADLMVNASFHALRREGKSVAARVLDPAAGAGVFLVSAFRQLVMERWVQDDKRPDTKTLREILYNQIVGFDINEAALRFAALGLYLMSIELDPEPEPIEKLRFNENLKDIVLHNLSKGASGDLGSLGKAVGTNHQGYYDLVIGNPPWASATQLPGWSEVTEIVTNIARGRLSQARVPQLLPNEVLDLPFVWRALEWAKPGGQIVFALHGRLLFLQGDGMAHARSAIFRALDVSSVVNGAELCQTRVWPEISAPFCLLFARNQLPPPGAAFRFVSPHLEKRLNDAGIMRIDTAKAELITTHQVVERTELLKILYRGSALDLEILDQMATRGLVPLKQYWRARFGEHNGRLRQAGNGYQRLRKSSRIRKKGDGDPGVPANYLAGLKELTPEAIEGILVDKARLTDFTQRRIHDPRPRSLFKAPLLLVRESPPVAAGRIRVALAESDLVYNQSYHGYSAWGDPQGHQLLRYIALLISSRPAIWYALITSGRFGVERRVVEKITIDGIPIMPFESLDPHILEQVDPLFSALVKEENPENWAAVDAWAANVYGLGGLELQTIDDTLRFNMPFAEYQNAAQIPPTQAEVIDFCTALKNDLGPWAVREDRAIEVYPKTLPVGTPWAVARVCTADKSMGDCALATDNWPEVLQIADSLAASEVIYPDQDSNCVWIARLNQARYWSRSQARLVARKIVWEQLETLLGSDTE
jgi:hypothetical protein